MAKKIVFLLVFLVMLALASVTAFAAGTTTTTDAALTTDKNLVAATESPAATVNYEEKYADLFFDPKAATEEFLLNIVIKRDFSTTNQLRHKVTGTVVQTEGADSQGDTIVMMMYIKNDDGKFIPLYSVDVKQDDKSSNVVEGSYILYSKVDLLNLGSDKVNDVRLVAFKKGAEKLELGVNLQITDKQFTVRNLTAIERVKIEFIQFKNAL